MKHILSISLGTSRTSSSEIIRLNKSEIRLTHLGVDFDIGLFESVLKSHDGKCDAICIAYIPQTVILRKKTLNHSIYELIDRAVKETPVFFGHNLRSIYMNWTVRRAMESGIIKFETANVLFSTGLALHDLAKLIEPIALTTRYLDAWTYLRLPLTLKRMADIETYAGRLANVLQNHALRHQSFNTLRDRLLRDWVHTQFKKADLIVSPSIILEDFDCNLLKGKILLLDSLSPAMGERLKKAGIQNVFYAKPEIEGTDRSFSYSVTEALIAFKRGQENSLSQEDILDFYSSEDINATIHQLDPTAGEVPRKFAFVIHPLSQRDLFRPVFLRPFMRLPKPMINGMEHALAQSPGVFYGRITGIRSESTGVFAEGLIYFVGATPREMMKAKPEAVYRRMVGVAEHSAKLGAKIMGLGAFTKIVGDAGVTIAARSPIAVTTGNSLSAAATLWAAKEACLKMDLLKMVPGRKLIVDGTVMIIGATGSIGKACTSVLGANFNSIIIAAINAPRLMAFQNELREMYPDCKVQITTQPERFASQCDLIVISTSATEGGAFKLDNVKPGCVICDVSRPLTFTAQEAMSRPDVLIIESGEIELPGKDVKVSVDMGLEKSIVYACLAETALLALEGRYESFTLSRNINYKKVKEIYKMARKHGARLAEIRSPNGIITDQEIELCREHALRALQTQRDNDG
ncbi:MAG: hypothetical protein H7249_01420 [Chitinophagaceae bacterium]|nr:hypothetical protein [Oligoflexus sp.]